MEKRLQKFVEGLYDKTYHEEIRWQYKEKEHHFYCEIDDHTITISAKGELSIYLTAQPKVKYEPNFAKYIDLYNIAKNKFLLKEKEIEAWIDNFLKKY